MRADSNSHDLARVDSLEIERIFPRDWEIVDLRFENAKSQLRSVNATPGGGGG
jgi:hypothetical protein